MWGDLVLGLKKLRKWKKIEKLILGYVNSSKRRKIELYILIGWVVNNVYYYNNENI